MSEHLIQYTGIAIDSAKFRIPLDKVEIVHTEMFDGKTIIDNGTGEILNEEWEKNKVEWSESGITTKMAIQHQVTSTGDVREFIVMQLNSKALMSAYQRGICMETLPLLCSHINSIGVIKVDVPIMLKSELTDIDLKKDAIFTDESMRFALKHCERHTKPSTKLNHGGKPFWQKDNKGYQWNTRKTSHTLNNPFVKVYSKHCDMQFNKKSVEFYRTFLSDFKTEGAWRFEVTIKDKSHMRKLGIHDNTLSGYFSLPQSRLDAIMKDLLNRNLGERVPKVLKEKQLNRNKMFMYSMVKYLMDEQIHISEIYHLSTRWIDAESHDMRKRLRKDVKEVYQHLLHEEDLKEKMKGTPEELHQEAEEIERIQSEYLGV